ncbi:hypothetical protein K1719_001223 [Acacia pycnantha]|nr:hypothetical protein K1719_001223 [Acacia pycnantha]
MSSLQIPNLSSSSSSGKRVHACGAINAPKLQRVRISLPRNPTASVKLIHAFTGSVQAIVPSEKDVVSTSQAAFQDFHYDPNKLKAIIQLFAILKTVADRVEVHQNIGEQRNNWSCLLLNSITTMMVRLNTSITHNNALRLTSILLLTSAKGMVLILNKIQMSKPNATTLFKKLRNDIQTTLITRSNPTEEDVNTAMDRVIALDKAHPLPLSSGTKLDKLPPKFEPKTDDDNHMKVLKSQKKKTCNNNNGWTPELEIEMRKIIEVVKKKDMEVYERRRNLVLMVNKTLAILGPLLTGIAAVGLALERHGSSWAGIVAIMAGSLADFINPLEGIVLEMIKNCGGFLQQTIEATLEEKDFEKRENGEVFEMKVAMRLGRSVCQLRQLAAKCAASCDSEGIAGEDEFSLQVMYSLLT